MQAAPLRVCNGTHRRFVHYVDVYLNAPDSCGNQPNGNCTSVLNIKADSDSAVDGMPELRRDAAGDDARLKVDSKRSSTVVGHPFAVQLPSSTRQTSGVEDVKNETIE